jgi:hypothetical protein
LSVERSALGEKTDFLAAMAMVQKEGRRATGGGKLAPIDAVVPVNTVARKIFSKKDLVESVRKMAVRPQIASPPAFI